MSKGKLALVALVALLLASPGVLLLGGCSDDGGDGGSASELIALWQLREVILDDGSVQVVDQPENYTVEFKDDGRDAIRADCNRCGGSYAVDGSRLTFGNQACTLIACGPGSNDLAFLSALGSTSSWEIRGGMLYLGYAGGQLVFSK